MKRLVLEYGSQYGGKVGVCDDADTVAYRGDEVAVFCDYEGSYFSWIKFEKTGLESYSYEKAKLAMWILHVAAAVLVVIAVSASFIDDALYIVVVTGVAAFVAETAAVRLFYHDRAIAKKIHEYVESAKVKEVSSRIKLAAVSKVECEVHTISCLQQFILHGYTAASSPLLQKLEEAYEAAVKVDAGQSCNLWLDIADCPLAVEVVADFYRQLGIIEQSEGADRAAEVMASLSSDSQEAVASACAVAVQQILNTLRRKEYAAKEAEELAKIQHQLQLDSDADRLRWSALSYLPYSTQDRQP
ncbi:MAG: hypothetical protein Q4B06_02645 [Candidatus Saccharibacteria bacterium]|nr:hypothetical protein [Candidatus Saccharibacteria bacterium]